MRHVATRVFSIAGGVLAIVGVTSLVAVALPATPPQATASHRSAESWQKQPGSARAKPIQAVDSVTITVADLDRSIAFFQDVLEFSLDSRSEAAGEAMEHLTGVFGCRILTARLSLGTEHVELRQFLAPEGQPMPVDSRSNDRWFQHIAIVVSDMDRAYAHLREHKVRHASSGPQTLPQSIPAAAGISAFYFKDPDGHVLEIIHFPPGKGDPRWQASTDRLFLGIDHTAIVVKDTDASLSFYHGVLGMRIAGASENFGTEQEHLNNVFGARLRITGLRAESGPGIELLEYLAPAGGRDYPTGTQSNDLWCWQTNIIGPHVHELSASLREHGTAWISPGVVSLGADDSAIAVQDRDGHAIRVMERAGSPR
ncbi:MAG: hypothetical protein AMXMBFR58_35660 [Phycisphaerae bacterium]|nr:hypothetical protein [Phycisphaerales bacterium]